MKVILLGELRGKGGEGDVVDVAQGYAENYLFPRRLALPATPGNIKQLEERRHNIERREEKRISDANAVKEALEGKTVTIEARVGEENQLFGSVTSAMIADAIVSQLGVEIDRKRISREGSIKRAGVHEIEIGLYRDINAKVAISVVPEGGAPAVAAEDAAADAAEEAVEEAAAEVVEEAAE